MAVVSVHSGVMVFGEADSSERAKQNPIKALVIGDFSGAAPRAQPLRVRKHLRVDPDNFDDVFARLGVSVALPFCDGPLRFSELDDMHPDNLYDSVNLFNRYRQLKKQLQSPNQFAAAAAQLSREGLIENPVDDVVAAPNASVNLLDSLLSGAVSDKSPGIADQLIRQTIAPYLQPKEHPKAGEYVAAVESAMSHVMRQIMHTSAFQQLEASWRSLDFLRRRVDLDRGCHLHVLDVSGDELLADFAASQAGVDESELSQNLAEAAASKGHYDVIIFDRLLQTEVEGFFLLKLCCRLAECSNAIFLCGSDTSSASVGALSDGLVEEWSGLRQLACAERIFIAAPRALLRLPYGAATAPIDEFPFEELPAQGAHEYYLWGNGAYLLLCGLLQGGRTNVGACFIDNLPLHVYKDKDGDEAIKPCAEFYQTEAQVEKLEDAGFTVLQSVQNANRVMIQRWRALKI